MAIYQYPENYVTTAPYFQLTVNSVAQGVTGLTLGVSNSGAIAGTVSLSNVQVQQLGSAIRSCLATGASSTINGVAVSASGSSVIIGVAAQSFTITLPQNDAYRVANLLSLFVSARGFYQQGAGAGPGWQQGQATLYQPQPDPLI